MKRQNLVTTERLREILHYDPDTGVFTRRVATSSITKIGDVAGYINDRGYCQISVDGWKYYAQRLAWLYVTGVWPAVEIDHINCDSADNRFSNLREATHVENSGNKRAYANNTSGFKGVSRRKRSNKWQVSIKVDGKSYWLGLFTSLEAAHAAYAQAADKAFGQFARAA